MVQCLHVKVYCVLFLVQSSQSAVQCLNAAVQCLNAAVQCLNATVQCLNAAVQCLNAAVHSLIAAVQCLNAAVQSSLSIPKRVIAIVKRVIAVVQRVISILKYLNVWLGSPSSTLFCLLKIPNYVPIDLDCLVSKINKPKRTGSGKSRGQLTFCFFLLTKKGKRVINEV